MGINTSDPLRFMCIWLLHGLSTNTHKHSGVHLVIVRLASTDDDVTDISMDDPGGAPSVHRAISFDVGIKNLAYCVLDMDQRQKTWTIASWQCVDLLRVGAASSEAAGGGEHALPCCAHALPGKRKADPPRPCGKRAIWQTPEAIPVSYCAKHAHMHTEFQFPDPLHAPKQLAKLKLPELMALAATHLVLADVRAKKPTKQTVMDQLNAHFARRCFRGVAAAPKKSHAPAAGSVDLVTIGRQIKRCFDSDPVLSQTSPGTTVQVLIENQISTIASRMKTIQGMIAQYFIMRFGDAVAIAFVSSHNKLKGFQRSSHAPAVADASSSSAEVEEEEEEEPTEETPQEEATAKKTAYKANKQDGIAVCQQFFAANLSTMQPWQPAFAASKKKDDLADCFLQAVGHLKKHSKLLSFADNLKINIV
jgi:hypothetical protein